MAAHCNTESGLHQPDDDLLTSGQQDALKLGLLCQRTSIVFRTGHCLLHTNTLLISFGLPTSMSHVDILQTTLTSFTCYITC